MLESSCVVLTRSSWGIVYKLKMGFRCSSSILHEIHIFILATSTFEQLGFRSRRIVKIDIESQVSIVITQSSLNSNNPYVDPYGSVTEC